MFNENGTVMYANSSMRRLLESPNQRGDQERNGMDLLDAADSRPDPDQAFSQFSGGQSNSPNDLAKRLFETTKIKKWE